MSAQAVLEECGDHVLAASRDQELFLAAGDGQEAFVIKSSDVAGVEPSIYEGFARGGLVVAVGREDVVALDQDLTVRANLDGDAGQGGADGADLDEVRGVQGCWSGGLCQPVALEHSDPDAPVEVAQIGTQRGTTRDRIGDLAAQGGPQLAVDEPVEHPVPGFEQ